MAPLLRRRLVCFYCGSRSGIKKDGSVREWLCKQCDAVNYLDENGDIADYVPPSPAQRVQFARPASQKPPSASQNNNNVFCSTCIQNQRLINENLAAYLPSPSHPDYAKYEAGYPKYREDLEDRYPPVCIDCEEGVMRKIRSAEYMASTDFLRRKIEQTKNSGRNQVAQSWGWRRLVIFLGGVLYMASLVLEIPWHVYGTIPQSQNDDGLRSERASLTIQAFVHQCLQLKDPDEGCFSLAAYFAGKGLILAIMSAWWNNQLWKKTLRGYNKLHDLNDYYKLQMVILGARFGAYMVLHHELVSIPEERVRRAGHVFMLVFLVLSTIVSLRTVKVTHAPRISFHRKVSPLAPRTQTKLRPLPQKPKAAYSTPANSQSNNFGLQKLPPLTPVRQPSVYQTPAHQIPPSPPASDGDPDEMDWTPSQPYQQLLPNPTNTFNYPLSSAISPYQSQQQATPSHNRGHRAHPSTTSADGMSLLSRSDDSDSDATYSPRERRQKKRQPPKPAPAPARFLLKDEHNIHTGLENLFDRVFTLRDEPPEVLVVGAQQQQRRASTNGSRADGPAVSTWQAWKDRVTAVAFAAPIIVVLYWFLGEVGRVIVARLAGDASLSLR